MKTMTFLVPTLTAMLLSMGCDLLDLPDHPDEPDGETTGDDDGGDSHASNASNGSTHGGDGNADDGGDGADGSSSAADDGGDGADGESGAADGGTSGGDGGSSGAAACEPDTQVCLDESTIAVCVDGEAVVIDCTDACIEIGAVGSLGCAFDEASGADVCLCDDGSGGGSGGA